MAVIINYMMAGPSTRRANTRSNGPIYDLDVVFPEMKTYSPSTKLPTIASAVGMLRSMSMTIMFIITIFIIMIMIILIIIIIIIMI